MLPVANKKTKEINSFVYCPIPSPRDMFNRYGARTGSEGTYLSGSSEQNCVQAPQSTIGGCISAQDYLSKHYKESAMEQR